MPQRGDPTRRLSALHSTPPSARTGWVPAPPEPTIRVRHPRGAHRRRFERADLDDKNADDEAHSEDDDTDTGIDADTDTDTDADGDPAPVRRAVAGPWGRMAEKWVPDSLREARVDPGRRGAVLLTVVAAVAAVVAAVGVWRDRPETRPVQPVALAPATNGASTGPASAHPAPAAGSNGARASPAAGTAPTTATSTTSTSTPSTLYVSVTGLVHKPGLVRLPPGSRVADAIEAAGGVTQDGDVTGMNLAALLSDGDSVVVGGGPAGGLSGTVSGTVRTVTGAVSGPGSAGGNGTAQAPGGSATVATPVNLNQADQAALESLPGVGPVMAGNILSWREEHGSFTSVEQLQEISGIGPTRYAQLAPLVTV